jgi:hypothetical protein
MKLLFENWREYLNENEDEDPFLEEYKQIIREEVQNELLRESHYGFKAPYATESMILWNVQKTLINSAGRKMDSGRQLHGQSTILKNKIYTRYAEMFPDQLEAEDWQMKLPTAAVDQTNILMHEIAKEVGELYDHTLQISDKDMLTKIWRIVYAVDGVGWYQALEILRTI